MNRRVASALILLCVVLFFGTRIALVTRAPAQLYHPEEYVNLRLAASLFGEEGAWDPVDAPRWPSLQPGDPLGLPPFASFQYQAFDGGTLAAAMVLTPIAAVLGLTPAAVKGGALLWAGLVLLLWLEVLRHAGGRRTMLAGAAAFALAPAPWLITSSVHWGNHAESAFGPPLILLLGLALRRSLGAQRVLASLALGGAAGFAVWFSQLNLLSGGLALLGALAVARPRWQEAPLVAVGALLGLAPRLLTVAPKDLLRFGAQQTSGTDLLQQLWGGQWTHVELKAMWASHPALATWDLHGLASLPSSGPLELWLRGVLLLCLVLASASALRRRQDGWGLVLSVCAVASLTWLLQPALLLASSELMPRRLANLYPLGCAVVALGSAAAGRSKAWAGVLILAAWVLPGAVGQATLLKQASPPEAPLTPWAWYAPPQPSLQYRVQAGLSAVNPDGVVAVQEALSDIYALPGEGAATVAAGFFSGFGQRETVLARQRIECGLPVGPTPTEPLGAWGFGRALRVRCPGQAPVACPPLAAPLSHACAAGRDGGPPPWDLLPGRLRDP